MIEKAASPWVTLPTIALALVTAVTECRKAERAMDEGSHTDRLLDWAMEELKNCKGWSS